MKRFRNLILSAFLLSASTQASEPIKVVWEGTYMDLTSLSLVNRAITSELAKMPQIKLTCVGPNTLNAKLATLAEIRDMFFRLESKAPDDVQFTIRQAWPPNWQPPAKGKWILIQPWEFGALPEEWVRNVEKVDEVWAISSYVKRVYVDSGVPAEKVFIVPNGVDPKIFHPEVKPYELGTNKKFKFLFLGGTIHRKGPDLLLKSYLNAFTAEDDVCLVVKDFGTKSCYAHQSHQAIFKAAQKVPNAPEIIYLDQETSADEIASIYTACDCLVHPYRSEGFGLPVLEAMACGIPVIVTAGGATDDFVNNEVGWFIPSTVKIFGPDLEGIKLSKNGWVLEPNTEVLSEQLRWVAKHPTEVRAKGSVASRHAHQNWSWKKAAEIAAGRLQSLSEPRAGKDERL